MLYISDMLAYILFNISKEEYTKISSLHFFGDIIVKLLICSVHVGFYFPLINFINIFMVKLWREIKFDPDIVCLCFLSDLLFYIYMCK